MVCFTYLSFVEVPQLLPKHNPNGGCRVGADQSWHLGRVRKSVVIVWLGMAYLK